MHVFLADFGLSHVISTKRAFGTNTMLSRTPGFQPPEQLMPESFDEQADVYACGVLLIELFSEKMVWEGLTHFQIMTKVVIQQQTPNSSDTIPAIQSIGCGCFKIKYDRSSMSAVLKELLALPISPE